MSELKKVTPPASLSRREVGRGVFAAAASICLPAVASAAVDNESKRPRTFVLVHGAFHGGLCYGRTDKLLRDRGHIAFTPTLSGLAERAHEFSGNTNLSTHVEDIVSLLRLEEVEKVVLCGHSYGGMVISEVGAKMTAKISAIVYLDAFLPSDKWCNSKPAKPPSPVDKGLRLRSRYVEYRLVGRAKYAISDQNP